MGIALLLHPPSKTGVTLTDGFIDRVWLCATPYVSESALQWLEDHATPLSDPPPDAQAIVILGGGSYFHALEYANQDIAGTHIRCYVCATVSSCTVKLIDPF